MGKESAPHGRTDGDAFEIGQPETRVLDLTEMNPSSALVELARSFAVVIITRNRPTVLVQCLDRLASQTVTPGKLVVVDSSDQFNPIQREGLVHTHFPRGRLQMPRGRNEGTRLAATPYVAFVDDDCLVDSDWLAQLCLGYLQDPELAGVGGRITDARYRYDPTSPIGRVTRDGHVYSNFFGGPASLVEVDFLPGGNMSFKTDWLLRVGGFDPAYVATNHREDPDLCLRVRQQGGRLAYQASAHALHLNARNSLGELKPYHEFYLRYSFARNEAFFFARHFPAHALRRWAEMLQSQSEMAWRARSMVAGLCVLVQAYSYALGLVSYMLSKPPKDAGAR